MGSNPIKGHFGTIRVRAACLQLSSKALGLRLPLDHELVLPGFGAVVREAQEVEGLRASLPSGGRSWAASVAFLTEIALFVLIGII
jgi:hypothetical protein